MKSSRAGQTGTKKTNEQEIKKTLGSASLLNWFSANQSIKSNQSIMIERGKESQLVWKERR